MLAAKKCVRYSSRGFPGKPTTNKETAETFAEEGDDDELFQEAGEEDYGQLGLFRVPMSQTPTQRAAEELIR